MAKSQKEFEQAVYELEDYFNSNADSRFGIYIGRKLTDNDYIEFVDDICKKYEVDFVPRKNDEFTYQVINKKSIKENKVSTDDPMFWINHIGDTALMEDKYSKWYVKDVKIDKHHKYLSEVIFIDLKDNKKFSVCISENIPIWKWI